MSEGRIKGRIGERSRGARVPISSEAERESGFETEHISNADRGSQSPAMAAASGLSISVPSEEHELRNWIFEAVIRRQDSRRRLGGMGMKMPQQELGYGQNAYGPNVYRQ
jgi:hypothetical protein